MDYRLIAIFVVGCLAFAEAGCSSSYEKGEEVLFPAQTGSRIQRRGTLERSEPRKPKKAKTKKKATPPRTAPERAVPEPTEAEAVAPSPTPPEATPTPPEKFR
jgi:hypothetical protein